MGHDPNPRTFGSTDSGAHQLLRLLTLSDELKSLVPAGNGRRICDVMTAFSRVPFARLYTSCGPDGGGYSADAALGLTAAFGRAKQMEGTEEFEWPTTAEEAMMLRVVVIDHPF